MTWVIGICGGVLGVVLAFFNNWSLGPSGALMAGLGYWLGCVLERSPQVDQKLPSSAGTGPVKTLAERVTCLESRVDTLSDELARRRPQSLDHPSVPTPEIPTVLVVPAAPPASPASPAPLVPVAPVAPALPVKSEGLQVVENDAAAVSLPASPKAVQLPPPPASASAQAEPSTPSEVAKNADAAHGIVPIPLAQDLLERAFNAARDWLLGGNVMVRIGILVLFFGVAFLLKYAASNSLLPIELRLAGTGIGAAVLLIVGWRLRESRAVYGLVLQGGGVGVLYLTVFSAVNLYMMIPAGMALPLMVVICALSAFLAIRQDAATLAFMGSAGGFLAPVLVSSGGGSHVALFSYYALLNAGIFAIAWFKAWRPLNLLGFFFTFGIGSAWGLTEYRTEQFVSTEAFLVLFFLMYVGIALLYAVRRELVVKHYVDGSLVFGTPIAVTLLQGALVRSMPFGLAWSAVGLSAFYLLVSAALSRQRERLALLFDSTLALGVIFATLAVPFAFSVETTSAAWALEGAAIVWLSVRQRRWLALLFGLVMQGAAAVGLLASLARPGVAPALPVLNGDCVAMFMIAVAGLFIGWWLQVRSDARQGRPWLPDTGVIAAIWGLCWWVAAGIREIQIHAAGMALADEASFLLNASVLFAVLSTWLAHVARRYLGWPLAMCVEQVLPPTLALLSLGLFMVPGAPTAGWGMVVWPLALASLYAILWRLPSGHRLDDQMAASPPYVFLHVLSFWIFCGVLAFEGYWRLREYVPEGAWRWSAWAYAIGLCLLAVSTLGKYLRWPLAHCARACQLWGAAPLALLLYAWSMASTASDGDAAPLFWLPLLNPLDVAQLLAFIALAAWGRRLRQLGVLAQAPMAEYLGSPRSCCGSAP